MTTNPLLEPFQKLHETAPFELIKNGHFLPATIKPMRTTIYILGVATLAAGVFLPAGFAQNTPAKPGASKNMTSNPLLQPFQTPHQTAPFPLIKNEHYLPAIQAGMVVGRKEIDAIVANPNQPTFANTVVALERSGDALSRATSVLFNLNAAETSPEMQKIVKEASSLLTEYGNDITLNDKLFARIKTVYDGQKTLKLDTESAMLLEKTYKRFARNGANLNTTNKAKLRAIDKELSQLSLQFGENVLAETNEYVMPVANEADLKGLPDFVMEAARKTAKEKGLAGWAFTLQTPSYSPFMQYAENRGLREKLYRAYGGRGFGGNATDNQANVNRMVQQIGRAHV